MNEQLLSALDRLQQAARQSKWSRLARSPLKYAYAVGQRKLVYERSGKTAYREATLFFGGKMRVALPSGTDIYLLGGKSHDSEIRLAKFLIRHLNAGDSFLDIGAHYGYFTRLAAQLTGQEGRVVAFEPAPDSFELLQQNTRAKSNIFIQKKAVADKPGTLVFYQFPNLYSEYNSVDVSQFQEETWFKEAQPERIEVEATSIDEITANGFNPDIIKIDVEGAEYSVISGGQAFLAKANPFIVMEYLSEARHNEQHQKAASLLAELSYKAHIINAQGQLQRQVDIAAYLKDTGLESDNIVFSKK